MSGRAAKQMMREPSRPALRENLEKVKQALSEAPEEAAEVEEEAVLVEEKSEDEAESLS